MKYNMGILDRSIRFALAFVFIVLYATNVVTGSLSIVLLVIAGFFILTSLIGVCPLYLPFHIDTRSHEKKKETQKE